MILIFSIIIQKKEGKKNPKPKITGNILQASGPIRNLKAHPSNSSIVLSFSIIDSEIIDTISCNLLKKPTDTCGGVTGPGSVQKPHR